jgi:ATP-dependent Clp protease protease subunit
VTSGFAIYDIMRFIRPEIRVVCTGLTASIATIILQGATPGQRYTLPSTRLLIHQPLIPSTVFGPASDLEITAREIIKTRQRINKLLADATGQKLDKVEKDTQRDYWLTADESVAYGLVDGIITELSALDAG